MLEAILVPDEHSAPFSLFGNSLTVKSLFCYLLKWSQPICEYVKSVHQLLEISETLPQTSVLLPAPHPNGFASDKAKCLLKTPSLGQAFG